MKSTLTRAAVAAVVGFYCAVGPARAIIFDVSGTNLAGDTLTGTIDANASLTTISSLNLVDSAFSSPLTVFEIFNYYPGGFTVGTADLTRDVSFFFVPNPAAVLQSNQIAYDNAVAAANAQFNVASCATGDTVCQTVVAQELASALAFPNLQYFAFASTATVSATPLPAALPLYGTGLGALALLRWRRKRKAAAGSKPALMAA
jgi:hypothetical protein